ncbi:hypothetical protein DITRI_Ditri02bG0121900 [Diplodiscus trichospermus]
MGRLSRLRNLHLSNNAINGRLLASLSNLTSLVLLNLESNALENQVPVSIENLCNLSVLVLKRNKFSGPIPATIGNISSLTQLYLSKNKLSGQIPFSLVHLKDLNSLNVSYNIFPGPVPAPLSQKFNSSSFVGNIQRRATSKAKDGQTTNKAATARGEKGTPPAGGEVEAGGEAGGKLVHFDGPNVFAADDLVCATAEIMGQSIYGTVYKVTLEDGNQVAVKRLREKVTKGQREFENEVNVLGKIRHTNLLALRAYYLGPKGKKLLVFDYMPKGSLATFMDENSKEGYSSSTVPSHPRECYTLTSSNVLLDEDTNAKIAYFGLSCLMTAAANANVIATTGTLGYGAPELSKLKKANTKTDVYSLGVIILELLIGKSPGEAMNGVDLPQWVASIVKEE